MAGLRFGHRRIAEERFGALECAGKGIATQTIAFGPSKLPAKAAHSSRAGIDG